MIARCALSLVLAAAPAGRQMEAFVPKVRPYDVQHYRVQFQLKEGGTFENTVDIALIPTKPVTRVEFDSFGLAIGEASFEGSGKAKFLLKEDPSSGTGTLTISAPKPLVAGKKITVTVKYSGKAIAGHEGLFTVNDESNPDALPYYFTDFEPTYARRFFPCNDQPFDKATTELIAIVDARYQVLSNGKKLEDQLVESDKKLRRVRWIQDRPHPTYAFAVAVGQLEQVPTSSAVPAVVHVPVGKSARAAFAANATRILLEKEMEFLGLKYPWDKYDQVAVPHFYWGGMENTSLVLAREDNLVLDEESYLFGRARQVGLIAHEMAHQWFGDLVTCKWWDDTWLNEGFATYFGPIAEEAYFQNDSIRIRNAADIVVRYFREEEGPRAHALKARSVPTPDDVFDGTSYVKGAQILRMLEHWVGRDAFRLALKRYLETYSFKNATSDDFFNSVAQSTGKGNEIRPFKEAWLRKKGYPVVVPKWQWRNGQLLLTIRQQPNRGDERGPFIFKLPIVFHRTNEPAYAREQDIAVTKTDVLAKISLPAPPEWINWNRNGTALARIDPESVDEKVRIAAAKKDPDPVWRLLSLYSLLEDLADPGATDMAVPSDDALDALSEAIAHDSSPYVREAILERLAMSRWNRLPRQFGPAVLQLAQNPTGLPNDSMGLVRARRAALEVLGKIDFEEGRAYLLAEVEKQHLPLDYLGAVAKGAARIGSSESVSKLLALVDSQKTRGYAYWKAALAGLAASENAAVVAPLAQILHQNAGNDELARIIQASLRDNHAVTESPVFTAFLSTFIIASSDFGEDIKGQYLQLLEETKNDAARDTAREIARKSTSTRLRAIAYRILESNFSSRAVRGARL